MNINYHQEDCCDVLVLGSGIAGISAALSAAERGARVLLACKGPLFSGSSFYPGTWGLGLIGPEDQADEEDLIRTIETVGCGMAQPELVETLVQGIHPAIEKLERMGVKLRKAQSGANQREYIPCFDHKHRAWNGIEFDSVRQVLPAALEKLGVQHLTGWEALRLLRQEKRITGALLSDGKFLRTVAAKAVVLATGGYGGIFRHHLCTDDVEGLGQALALDAGCRLVNMEFMQMMPGYLHPAYQTVFNEKTFRFAEMTGEGGPHLRDTHGAELLAQRAGHGPFTSRLASREVDLTICREPQGVAVRYAPTLRQDPPEFIKTYFDWLQASKGLTMEDTVHIGLFAHAANGGVVIRSDGATDVPGLYAAGEVTGGMHGADRIGGLSTANGLVFGGIAGASAAEFAAGVMSHVRTEQPAALLAAADCRERIRQLRETMTTHAMVVRSNEGLEQALDTVRCLSGEIVLRPTEDVAQITETCRLRGQLETAEAILRAELLRQESRGSHYRADHPQENPALARQILIWKSESGVQAAFASEKQDRAL